MVSTYISPVVPHVLVVTPNLITVVPQRFTPVLAELAPLGDIFRKADRRLYVVGGTVRDLLLDRQMSEVDLTSPPMLVQRKPNAI